MSEILEIPKRRVRMLMIQPQDFMAMLTKGMKFRKNFRLVEGLPDDARVINIAADSNRVAIMLVVESEEFDEHPINELPPIQPIQIDIDAMSKPKKVKK